jgi:hypothetical protein
MEGMDRWPRVSVIIDNTVTNSEFIRSYNEYLAKKDSIDGDLAGRVLLLHVLAHDFVAWHAVKHAINRLEFVWDGCLGPLLCTD